MICSFLDLKIINERKDEMFGIYCAKTGLLKGTITGRAIDKMLTAGYLRKVGGRFESVAYFDWGTESLRIVVREGDIIGT